MTAEEATKELSSRPVIVIHGVGTTTDTQWRKTGWVDRLEASGRTVIGVDLPGHGTSKNAVDRDPADLVLEQAAKHGSVDAIGFSAGSWALLVAASEQPDLFDRIAVLGAADMVLTAALHTPDMHVPMAAALRTDTAPADNPMAIMFRTMIADAGNDRNSVADYLAADKRFPTLDDLSKITAATLVVEGGADEAGPSDEILQAIPKAERVVIDGANHFNIPMNEETLTAVEAFLTGGRL